METENQLLESMKPSYALQLLHPKPKTPVLMHDYRLGGQYRGSLIAAPRSRYWLAPIDHPHSVTLHTRACDRIRAGDVDWDTLRRVRLDMGHMQYEFLKTLMAIYGLEEAAIQLRIPPTQLLLWSRHESIFLEDEYKAFQCHAALLEGEWTLRGDADLVGAPPAAGGSWHNAWDYEIMEIMQTVPGATWLTIVEGRIN